MIILAIQFLILLALIVCVFVLHKDSFVGGSNCLDNYFDSIVCICVPERKEHMKKCFRKWGVKKVKFFNAYLKKDYTHEDFIRMGFLSENYSDYLNLGRICCHYSATAVYKDFLDSKHNSVLIFEDDLNKDMFKNVHDFNKKIGPYIESIPSDWEYINFSKCHDFCRKNIIVNKHWTIPNRPLCRTAIALKKPAAQIIVSETSPMKDDPGDRMIGDLVKDKRFKAYGARKVLFHQHREKFGSNLGNRAKTNPRMCARESIFQLW